MLLLASTQAVASSIHSAPRLPLPDGPPIEIKSIQEIAKTMRTATPGTVVRVDTSEEIIRAIENATDGVTILVKPGKYVLPRTAYMPGPAKNVTLRGEDHDPLKTQLIGPGMAAKANNVFRHALLIGNVQGLTIANLTIRDVPVHCIALNGGEGCDRVRIYNCRLIDAGEQFVKANPGNEGEGVDEGVVEYTAIAYSTAAKDPYTNGIDVHQGKDWIIRNCFFRNITMPDGDRRLAGPTILVWNRSSDTIVEGNFFYNCDTAISFGRGGKKDPFEHRGGIIRNNFIFRSAGTRGDVGIALWNSPDTKVLHNTIVLNRTYPYSIDARFPLSTGIVLHANLSDAPFERREGARFESTKNVHSARGSWFVDVKKGNLRLTADAIPAIDAVDVSPMAPYDYDATRRPRGEAADIGAAEK